MDRNFFKREKNKIMKKEKILKYINQIEKLLAGLKAELGLEAKEKIKKPRKKRDMSKKLDLKTPIEALIEDGFFSDWKKDIHVVQKLKEKILMPRTLRRSSVTNVLRRLFGKGLLVRKEVVEGKKKVLVYKAKK